MLQLKESGEDRPTLPDWFVSSFVSTRRKLETLEPWVSLREYGADEASEHKNRPSDTTTRTAQESDIYEIDSRVYKHLLALARPAQLASSGLASRFDYDVLALRLPGQIKQPSGFDFLEAVAKLVAKDIGADFVHLDYDILQAMKPHCHNTPGRGHEPTHRRLVRQGKLENALSSITKSKWTEYFYEILSIAKTNTQGKLEERSPQSQALVVAFMDLWREAGDEAQKNQQEEVRRAFGEALRSFTTRDYPVLVVTIDVPVPPANTSSSMNSPFHRHGQLEKSKEYEDRYELMDQLGQRPLRQAIEICPIPSQPQRQLLKRDQEHNIARDNIRRIQSCAKASRICTTSRLLDPPSDWEFLRSSPAYKLLSDPKLSNNQVVSIASQLRADCSEANVRQVVSSASAWSESLSSWANERESKRAETLDVDGDTQVPNKEPQDPASRRSNKIRDAIDRIKKDREEFEWEYELIDSIIEPAEMSCTWDDIEIDETRRSYIKRLMSHNFSQTKPYGVMKSGGVRGALLYGPPGTGKTHLARILAKESNAAMLYVSAAELESCWVGQTEKIIKALFRLGRMLFPSIVFIDEAEAFLKARGQRDQRWEVSQVNQFLREADGLLVRKDSPFLLLATNNPMLLDKAVLRRVPGTLYIGPPSLQSREKIFRIVLREERLDSSVDLSYLASRTHRYSGSDIKAVCFNAASACQMDIDNMADGSKTRDESPRRLLTMAHFEDAFKATRPTVTESVMQPLSEFASEFDSSAFAEMQVFKDEESAILYNQLKQSRSIQQIEHDVQPSQRELAAQVGGTIPSNTTGVVVQEESNNGGHRGGSAGLQGYGDDLSPCSTSHYMPLDSSTGEIRLLQIVNTEELEKGGPIRCSLHVVPLSESPSFTALSYVWGEPDLTEEVWVDGKRVQVRSNLTAALRRAPYHWLRCFPGRQVNDLRIWADALSIDQQNLAERNHQVAMMGEIYTQAELVMSSIAKDSPSIRLALETYRDIHATLFTKNDPPSINDLVFRRWAFKVPALRELTGTYNARGPHRSQPAWDALHQFVALPYWRRVWIIQEIFLARRVLLICDFEALDFTYISEISSLLTLQELNCGYEGQAKMQGELGGSAVGQRVCCTTCYKTIRNPAPILDIYSSKAGGSKHHFGSPGFQMRLLRMTTQLQASEPRDVVYGLLGLSKLPVGVDYSQTVGTVFSQYVQHWIGKLTSKDENDHHELEEARASLGFTYCLVFAGSARAAHTTRELQAEMLPSWVPKFCTTLPDSQFDPERQISVDNKAWNFSDLFGLEFAIRLDYPVLDIDGFRLDLVERSTELAEISGGSLPWPAWDRMRTLISKGSPYVTGIPPLQALIRVLQTCPAHATTPISKVQAQDLVMGSTLCMMPWMLPVDRAGVRRRPIRLLDPHFQSPFAPGDDATNVYRWIARTAFPNFPELEQEPPSYLGNWEQIRQDVGSATPYTNVSLIELQGGYLGLGPNTIPDKSIVCILQGCHRPVILRKEGNHYTLIGTCYVLGLMRWEEVKSVIQEGNLKQETFKIR